jgi:hypothetical protein
VIDAERRKLLSELHCLGGTRLRQWCFCALAGGFAVANEYDARGFGAHLYRSWL